MATTVNQAFADFNKNIVNLDPDRTKTARSSRDWLLTQLNLLPEKIDTFPFVYDEKNIRYGSFARNTKVRPLDDIDLFLALKGGGATYQTHIYGMSYTINVPETAANLRRLCNEDGTLNSNKVINKVVNSLYKIEHYKAAEIHRKQEAAILQLNSYEWNFDIVPCFYTDTGYYLIPDGSSGWKASDPRVDQSRVTALNTKLNGRVLQLIRTLKYWNNNKLKLSSYLFENFILNFCDTQTSLSEYIDWTLRDFWNYFTSAIFTDIPDPKKFQGNLNTLSFSERLSISGISAEAAAMAELAYTYESTDTDHHKAIIKWGAIFGAEFPKYE